MPLKSLILNWAAVDETTTDLFIYDEIAHEKSFDWAKGERGPEVTAREVMDKRLPRHCETPETEAGRSPARLTACVHLPRSMWPWLASPSASPEMPI